MFKNLEKNGIPQVQRITSTLCQGSKPTKICFSSVFQFSMLSKLSNCKVRKNTSYNYQTCKQASDLVSYTWIMKKYEGLAHEH